MTDISRNIISKSENIVFTFSKYENNLTPNILVCIDPEGVIFTSTDTYDYLDSEFERIKPIGAYNGHGSVTLSGVVELRTDKDCDDFVAGQGGVLSKKGSIRPYIPWIEEGEDPDDWIDTGILESDIVGISLEPIKAGNSGPFLLRLHGISPTKEIPEPPEPDTTCIQTTNMFSNVQTLGRDYAPPHGLWSTSIVLDGTINGLPRAKQTNPDMSVDSMLGAFCQAYVDPTTGPRRVISPHVFMRSTYFSSNSPTRNQFRVFRNSVVSLSSSHSPTLHLHGIYTKSQSAEPSDLPKFCHGGVIRVKASELGIGPNNSFVSAVMYNYDFYINCETRYTYWDGYAAYLGWMVFTTEWDFSTYWNTGIWTGPRESQSQALYVLTFLDPAKNLIGRATNVYPTGDLAWGFGGVPGGTDYLRFVTNRSDYGLIGEIVNPASAHSLINSPDGFEIRL